MQKRVAAIHDISCFGRCSLTVALPILSAAGVETSIIPTAVLSTHTGGFKDFTFRDLTEDILPIAEHWKSLDIEFDAIYTGYLGSFRQLEIVSKLFDMFERAETLRFVDPVMADNGKLYASFAEEFPTGMAKLCSKADIIIPNITEAVLMLKEEFKEGPYTKEYIEYLLKKLASLGPKQVVLTGVYFDMEEVGAATYDCKTGEVGYVFQKKIPGYYHGTGDIFGSALLAALMKECNLNEAAKIAVTYTTDSIKRSYQDKTDVRFGVNFEAVLGSLNTGIEKIKSGKIRK